MSKTPDKSTPRLEDYDWMPSSEWKARHARLKEQAAGGADIAFYGDSITEAWPDTKIWKEKWAPRGAKAFGIGGDRTQNLLWRIEEGEAEGPDPAHVVLLIGTNNFGHFDQSAAEVAKGVKACALALKGRYPKAQLWIMGIFPAGEKPDFHLRERIRHANAEIAGLADGRHLHYIDMERELTREDGSIDPAIMPDFLHLSEKGYEIWTRVLFEKLALH